MLVLVVIALAGVGCRVTTSHRMAVIPSVCSSLDPVDNWFLWWWNGCQDPKPAAGGGDSGAGN